MRTLVERIMSKAASVFTLVVGLSAGAGVSYLLSSPPTGQRPSPAPAQAHLADKDDARPVVANLAAGHRAFTLKTQGSSAVCPAGVHVDLLCVIPDPKRPTLKMTRIFLQDKLVIAVEPSKEPDQLLITLEVTPEESERLFHALISGPITVLYRKAGDAIRVKTMGATSAFGRAEPIDEKE
jgi:Flp pilus assembly protein CpaB